MPHKKYFAGTLLGMSSCASYVSRTHDVIDDVTRSQSRSNFESDISPSIFELESRSKAQNFGNAHGYLSGYSTSGITSGKKILSGSKWRPFWKFSNIKHSFKLTSDLKRSSQISFYGDDVIDGVTGWPQSFSLDSCLGEVGSGSKLQGQCLNKCKYRNCLSRLYMPKDDQNELHFSILQVNGQYHRLTGWPWH